MLFAFELSFYNWDSYWRKILQFKFVDELMNENRLKPPSLSVLRDGGDLARYAILQPKGDILADQNSIKSSTASNAYEKTKAFLASSKTNHLSLIHI